MTEDTVTPAGAWFSPDRRQRYYLWRTQLLGTGRIVFIMLNPSTADALQLDPTVTRCVRYGFEHGFQTVGILNCFSLRSTDPRFLYEIPHTPEILERNVEIIGRVVSCERTTQIVCAWGTHAKHHKRSSHILTLLRAIGKPLFHFGLNQDGSPKHPLYLKRTLEVTPWV